MKKTIHLISYNHKTSTVFFKSHTYNFINMTKKKYKFKIEEKLNELPFDERNKVLKSIPQQLEITPGTFYSWRRIVLESKQDIPSVMIAALAKMFDCPIEEMFNTEIPTISKTPITKSRSSIAGRFGMSSF
ncbi:hypothetical protein DMA11_10190 [Marinilabiliaceae bacterium JC017]|nr:hypothetical protein DMA11_10190 [Marinilabiliaceae bacterium JC017]